MSLDPSAKTIAKGAGIVIVGIFLSKMLAFVYRIIVARVGVEQYGILSLAMAILGILFPISLLGLNTGIVRYVSFYRARQDNRKIKGILLFSIGITMILSLFLAIMLFFLSDSVAILFFHNQRLIPVLKIIAFAVPISALTSIFLSTIRAFQQIKYEVYSKNLIENVLKIVLTILFLVIGLKVVGLVLAYVLSLLSTLILAIFFFKRKIFPEFTKTRAFFINKELFFYSLPLLFVTFMASVIFWTDSFMLGYFKDISQVGIYNAAQPVAHLIYTVPYALITLFTPVATSLYSQNKKEQFSSIFKTTTKWIFILNMPVLLIITLFSKQLLGLVFGNQYIPGSVVLIILACSYFFFYLLICSSHLLIIYKKTNLIALNSILGTICNVILNFLLIPLYGIIGAAIATGLSFVLIAFLYSSEAYLLSKIFPFKTLYYRVLSSTVIPIFFILGSNYLFNTYKPSVLLPVILIFSLLYFISLILTKSFEKEDLILMNLIKDKTRLKLNFLSKIIS